MTLASLEDSTHLGLMCPTFPVFKLVEMPFDSHNFNITETHIQSLKFITSSISRLQNPLGDYCICYLISIGSKSVLRSTES